MGPSRRGFNVDAECGMSLLGVISGFHAAVEVSYRFAMRLSGIRRTDEQLSLRGRNWPQ